MIPLEVLRIEILTFWRRTNHAVGRPAACSIVIGVALCTAAAWGFLLPRLRSAVAQLAMAQDGLEWVLLASMFIMFLLMVAIMRTSLLALDPLSQEVRILLRVSPLSRISRSLATTIPDFLLSLVLSSAIGAVGPVSVLDVLGGVGLPAVILGILTSVAAAGAVCAVLEVLFFRITRDASASRMGAAIGLLVGVCALIIGIAGRLRTTAPAEISDRLSPITGQNGIWLNLTLALSFALLMIIWVAAGCLMTADTIRTARRRPSLVTTSGSTWQIGALSSSRGPDIRLGFVGMIVFILLCQWIEAETTAPVGQQGILIGSTIAIGGASIMTYGSYLPIRWRVAISPRPAWTEMLRWIGGCGIISLLSGASCVLAGFLGRLLLLGDIGGIDLMSYGLAWLPIAAGGLVAGRVLPYSEESIASVAGGGALSMLFAAPIYYVTTQSAWPLAIGLFVLLAAVSIVVSLERR